MNAEWIFIKITFLYTTDCLHNQEKKNREKFQLNHKNQQERYLAQQAAFLIAFHFCSV